MSKPIVITTANKVYNPVFGSTSEVTINPEGGLVTWGTTRAWSRRQSLALGDLHLAHYTKCSTEADPAWLVERVTRTSTFKLDALIDDEATEAVPPPQTMELHVVSRSADAWVDLPEPVNSAGLTWEAWLIAAGVNPAPECWRNHLKYVDEWKAAIDPSSSPTRLKELKENDEGK